MNHIARPLFKEMEDRTPLENEAYRKHHEEVWKRANEWERMQLNYGEGYVLCDRCPCIHRSVFHRQSVRSY